MPSSACIKKDEFDNGYMYVGGHYVVSNVPENSVIDTLTLSDALPISRRPSGRRWRVAAREADRGDEGRRGAHSAAPSSRRGSARPPAARRCIRSEIGRAHV